jgi:hypothetical protein
VFRDPPRQRNRVWQMDFFRGGTFAEAFTGDDPLLRHVRTRVRSPQTNGVVERFFGTLKYEHLRPHQALDDRTPRPAYLTSRESQ